jgi:hypothetical protein
MKPSWFERYAVLLFVGSIAVVVIINAALMLLPDSPSVPVVVAHHPTQTRVVPTPTPRPLVRPNFERGIVFPRWGAASYGPSDTAWKTGLSTIHARTGAQWLEMPLQFEQANGQSTALSAKSLPSIEHFQTAIQQAHRAGYKLFVTPLFLVHISGGWAASIQLPSVADQKKWFSSLSTLYTPYLKIAQKEHVEQVSLGTELVWMQQYADPTLWTGYLHRVHALYSGTITYDSNWSEIWNDIPSWMADPDLSAIGVSEYIQLATTQSRIAPAQIAALWQQNIQAPLDAFSIRAGKPIFLSEIGYRNSFDTLWSPWDATVHAPADETERIAAITAALSLSFADTHIMGMFWWGWTDTGAFDLKPDSMAQNIIATYYERAAL